MQHFRKESGTEMEAKFCCRTVLKENFRVVMELGVSWSHVTSIISSSAVVKGHQLWEVETRNKPQTLYFILLYKMMWFLMTAKAEWWLGGKLGECPWLSLFSLFAGLACWRTPSLVLVFCVPLCSFQLGFCSALHWGREDALTVGQLLAEGLNVDVLTEATTVSILFLM